MSGILTLKIPSRQYAISSTRLVSRLDAHDILRAMLNSPMTFWTSEMASWGSGLRLSAVRLRARASMLVMDDMRLYRLDFDPNNVQSLAKNLTLAGASSSWSVHPLVN